MGPMINGNRRTVADTAHGHPSPARAVAPVWLSARTGAVRVHPCVKDGYGTSQKAPNPARSCQIQTFCRRGLRSPFAPRSSAEPRYEQCAAGRDMKTGPVDLRPERPIGGRRVTAVGGDHLAGNVVGRGARQEDRETRDVVGRAETRVRLGPLQPRRRLGRVYQLTPVVRSQPGLSLLRPAGRDRHIRDCHPTHPAHCSTWPLKSSSRSTTFVRDRLGCTPSV